MELFGAAFKQCSNPSKKKTSKPSLEKCMLMVFQEAPCHNQHHQHIHQHCSSQHASTTLSVAPLICAGDPTPPSRTRTLHH